MASTAFLFSSSIILLSLLVIASAADYGYSTATPETVKPKPEPNSVYNQDGYGSKPKSLDIKSKSELNVEYVSKPELKTPKKHNDEYISKSESETPKNSTDKYVSKSKLETPKNSTHEYVSKSESETPKKLSNEYISKPNVETPKMSTDKYVPKPELKTPKKPTDGYAPKSEMRFPIGIEGLILCKSGSNYIPIKGAVARITCSILGHNRYEATPFSCLTSATDAKGFFYKTLSDLRINQILQLADCRVKLEKSPLESCNIATNVNKGITGALLSSYQILHDKKIKLYPVGPFFYTSESDLKSTPTPTSY